MEFKTGKLFATPVWAFRLDQTADLNQQLIAAITEMRSRDPQGTSRTNTLGWQSLPDLQNRPAFRKFTEAAVAAVKQIGGIVKIRPDADYRIEAWANISHRGAYNVIHTHPNCHFSGVYYVRTPPGCGDIFFRDPRSQAVVSIPPVAEDSQLGQKDLAMEASEGTMYVFPSWLDHGVEPNGSDEDRVSIAFNVAVREPS